MTTLRQLQANRRNATLSTGPKTPAGVEAAKANALSHEMTASEVRHEEEEGLIRRRLEDWETILQPEGAYQRWLAEQVVAASVRIENCGLHEEAWMLRQSSRAAFCWDADRRVDVERLSDGLARRPSLVALQLRQSPHGCDWLLARWHGLALSLRDPAGDGSLRPLDDAGRRLACDLLVVIPEFRAVKTPLDPPPGVDDVAVHQAALIAAPGRRAGAAQGRGPGHAR